MQRAAPHRTRKGAGPYSLQTNTRGPKAGPAPRHTRTIPVILKGFSYAMIGAFVGGLAMTVAGSANLLLAL